MRLLLATLLFAGLSGCGPLLMPMAPKLSPEDQRQVDQIWENVLTPVGRVDRQTLLDTNIAGMLFTVGVDRMRLTSEKYFKGGTAVMEMDCDRASPRTDQFTVTVLDERGRTLRRERYTRAEVEESAKLLHGLTNRLHIVELEPTPGWQGSTIRPSKQPEKPGTSQPASQPVETPEQRRQRLEYERRWKAVFAATQPARVAHGGRR